jgi:hypothetical protein
LLAALVMCRARMHAPNMCMLYLRGRLVAVQGARGLEVGGGGPHGLAEVGRRQVHRVHLPRQVHL